MQTFHILMRLNVHEWYLCTKKYIYQTNHIRRKWMNKTCVFRQSGYFSPFLLFLFLEKPSNKDTKAKNVLPGSKRPRFSVNHYIPYMWAIHYFFFLIFLQGDFKLDVISCVLGINVMRHLHTEITWWYTKSCSFDERSKRTGKLARMF